MIYCEVLSLLIHNWSLLKQIWTPILVFSRVLVSTSSIFSFPASFRSVFYFHAYSKRHQIHRVLVVNSTKSCDFRDLCFPKLQLERLESCSLQFRKLNATSASIAYFLFLALKKRQHYPKIFIKTLKTTATD